MPTHLLNLAWYVVPEVQNHTNTPLQQGGERPASTASARLPGASELELTKSASPSYAPIDIWVNEFFLQPSILPFKVNKNSLPKVVFEISSHRNS